jgi:hypothetical protein
MTSGRDWLVIADEEGNLEDCLWGDGLMASRVDTREQSVRSIRPAVIPNDPYQHISQSNSHSLSGNSRDTAYRRPAGDRSYRRTYVCAVHLRKPLLTPFFPSQFTDPRHPSIHQLKCHQPSHHPDSKSLPSWRSPSPRKRYPRNMGMEVLMGTDDGEQDGGISTLRRS